MTGLFLLFAIAILIIGTIGLALPIVDKARDILKTAALDIVQIYLASHNAELDIKERQFRLDNARDLGQLAIAKQRQMLSGPVESEVNQ